MKATGIIRRVDELGRVVIPKEIRQQLKINENDPMEFWTTPTGIFLRKYTPAGYFAPVAGETYAHRAGGEYFCQKVYNDHSAVFVRKSDGWTADVYGVQREEDGTIAWDYSLNGCFKKEAKA